MYVWSITDYIRDNPDNDVRRYRFARALAALGRTESAKREYDILLERDFRSADCHYELACIALNAADDATAIQHLQNAITYSPDDADCLRLLTKLTD